MSDRVAIDCNCPGVARENVNCPSCMQIARDMQENDAQEERELRWEMGDAAFEAWRAGLPG